MISCETAGQAAKGKRLRAYLRVDQQIELERLLFALAFALVDAHLCAQGKADMFHCAEWLYSSIFVQLCGLLLWCGLYLCELTR